MRLLGPFPSTGKRQVCVLNFGPVYTTKSGYNAECPRILFASTAPTARHGISWYVHGISWHFKCFLVPISATRRFCLVQNGRNRPSALFSKQVFSYPWYDFVPWDRTVDTVETWLRNLSSS
jgi:hypothetical protein